MTTDPYAHLDATAQADLVARREVKPEDLVDAAIARLEAFDPQLGVLVTPLFDKARDAARGVLPGGPFRGVPMLLKDLVAYSAGDPLYEGSAFLRNAGWVEREDSYLVRAFKAAGLVVVGKSKTPEFGLVSTTEPAAFGVACNPWDVARGTGGPAAARPRRSPPASSRSPTPTMVAAPSASPPACAGWSGSSRHGRAPHLARTMVTC